MKILAVNNATADDRRIPVTPSAVERLTKAGFTVSIEPGLGSPVGLLDGEFEDAGAAVAPVSAWAGSDAIAVGLQMPELAKVDALGHGRIYLGFLDPFLSPDLISAFAGHQAAAHAMELIPRITRAQSMDALSSQANLAGYQAVLLGATRGGKILPMMNTAAGTVRPARVLVIGAGVAGLQAIATAKRLGAIVSAYDTRPVVAEQVRSLGARFIQIDVGETKEDSSGYAKELTAEQLNRQQEQLARHVAASDLVVTTAQVFGRRAPRIVTANMVGRMHPGTVIVDLAASTGGNVEGTAPGEEIVRNGVLIIGHRQLAEQCALDASELYANNVANFLVHACAPDSTGRPRFIENDEIVDSTRVTAGGQITHPAVAEAVRAWRTPS